MLSCGRGFEPHRGRLSIQPFDRLRILVSDRGSSFGLNQILLVPSSPGVWGFTRVHTHSEHGGKRYHAVAPWDVNIALYLCLLLLYQSCIRNPMLRKCTTG
jgi:hypothetical protein